ncbi:MAG: tetratricopeptide repeat protein, partial [Thermoanaerobaculia bacterium]
MKKKALKVGAWVVLVTAAVVAVAFGTSSGKAVVGWAAGQVRGSSEPVNLGKGFVGRDPQSVAAEMREIWLKAEEGDLGALFVFPEALTEEVGQRTLFEIAPPELAEIQELAARGVPRGLVEMAERYRDGEGVEQDLEKARRLFLEAAEKGHPEGHVGLAKLYFEGEGVPQSYEEALGHFRVAAEGRQVSAQRRLAEMYLDGLGVEESDEEAVKWY